jgi:trans-aconitate 2-methyltransferase
MSKDALKSYPIKGGKTGRARLSVMARILGPTTEQLIARVGPLAGQKAVDAACGGGDVTFALAHHVGPNGHVTGLDLDEEKLGANRDAAQQQGLTHVSFEVADVSKPWPVADVDLVYARFILTHLAEPQALLRQALAALKPGGIILVEDIDIPGYFWHPDCPALTRYIELYMALSRRRGGDPLIGRRLPLLLEQVGFDKVEATVVQPFSRKGGPKEVSVLTLDATSEGLLAEKLVTPEELAQIKQDLTAFVQRPDTIVSMPRIFQAWGRKNSY